jgi:hypothetical protein
VVQKWPDHTRAQVADGKLIVFNLAPIVSQRRFGWKFRFVPETGLLILPMPQGT